MLITQTPLRISFAGGGTDLAAYYRLSPGAVLSSAIDKFVYVILNQRFDDKIYISYSKKEIVDTVDEIQHELVREAMRMTGVKNSIEIAIMADIPSAGSGLGSSSSLTVGLLNAFYTFRGIQVSTEQLAQEACRIEVDICGKAMGKQDEYIAAYGGLQFIEFNPDETVSAKRIEADRQRFSSGLMLFFTDVTRKADPILREQETNTEAKKDFLDGIRGLADEAKEAAKTQDYHRIGNILARNWEMKKELAGGITKPEIDEMVSRAMAGGADGCKICGAGGGGFLLTACAPEKTDRLRKAMSGYREMPFFLERLGSRVIFNVESYEWK
ncbi:MAG: GHMP kinase [Kiritimatiellia bacterium]|jgi:D-glycero-alpha-D-manno-heptose-7-phosphate kinase|nr:GHMP kinase [Kiritimatiellia bacterium]